MQKQQTEENKNTAETRRNNGKNAVFNIFILSIYIIYLLNYITFIIIYDIIKIMKSLKKLWIPFAAMLPMTSWAIAPLVIGAIAVGVGIVGVSIWRSVAPVNMHDALDFFTSCWSCHVFSDIMMAMSNLLPGLYKALGKVIIPMSIMLLGVLIAWRIASNMINGKDSEPSKIFGNMGTYTVKLALLIGLLLMPLPRLITNVFIEPAFVIGSSLNYVVTDNDKFAECMVATALADPLSATPKSAEFGAFSPSLRHQITCEIANVHQITGLGMTVGWTILNMAFHYDYQHKILSAIPLFPNVPMLLAGGLILLLYFYALLPIPLYFLEIFVKLSMDLIMLPFMLMAWMFDDENFKIFPQGGRTIRQMLDDVVKAIVGIALCLVLLTFSVMFINATFGSWSGSNVLEQAITQNDSKILINGLLMQNDSIITVVLMGIFIAMFMTMIPQISTMLFKTQISDKYYQTAKKDLDTAWNELKKIHKFNKK